MKVLNKHSATQAELADAVYIGRPSKWGNPFVIGKDGDRQTVIDLYEDWLAEQPHLIAALHELRGKDLVCWCAPHECHGDVLIKFSKVWF